MSLANPLKHAHLFQRTLSDNTDHAHLFQTTLSDNTDTVYAYVGLLETNGDQHLEEDALNILSHAQKKLIDTEGSLRDVFTIATVDKNTEWGAGVNNAMMSAKKDYCSPHPTVSEYLKMPCWPRFSTEPAASSLLQTSGFRAFVTEKTDTYVVFGISTHPLIPDSPEEAWLTLDPQGAKPLQAPCKTNGSTLDQVLTLPVWKDSSGSTWSLSYNNQTSNAMYDELNQLAVEWYKGEMSIEQYNASVKGIQTTSGIWVQSNRLINDSSSRNLDFIKYIAVRTLLFPDNHQSMLQSSDHADLHEANTKRAFQLSLCSKRMSDITPLLTRQELEQATLNQVPSQIKQIFMDAIEHMSDEDLMAMINGNLFFTDDGYLLMKHQLDGETVWTNFDFSFPDKNGLPFHDLDDEYLTGKFVIADQNESVANQYQTILQSKHEFEGSIDALSQQSDSSDNQPTN